MPPKTPYDHLEQQVPAMRLVAKVVGFFVPSVRESWKSAETQLEKLQEMRLNIGLFPGGHPNSPTDGHLKLPHLS